MPRRVALRYPLLAAWVALSPIGCLPRSHSERAARPVPGAPVGRFHEDLSPPAALSAGNCEAALAALRDREVARMEREVEKAFERWKAGASDCWRGFRDTRKRRLSAGGSAAAPPPPAVSTPPVSSPNLQVEGVDEADWVAHDGRYVYIAAERALWILDAAQGKVVSETPVDGEADRLFLDGDRVLVYVLDTQGPETPCAYAYDCAFQGLGRKTSLLVLDVSDRARPIRKRSIEVAGSLLAARRVGHAVHTIVNSGDASQARLPTTPRELPLCYDRANEASARQRFDRLARDNRERIAASVALPRVTEQGRTESLCEKLEGLVGGDLAERELEHGWAFTSIVSIDLEDDGAPPSSSLILSGPGAVYASAESVYLVAPPAGGLPPTASIDGGWGSVSRVHHFGLKSRFDQTGYLGSGTVPGHVVSQYSLDEWQGALRVVTSSERIDRGFSNNALSILRPTAAGRLERTGQVSNLGRGEDVRAVRFDRDRGYVTTFERTDPLHVLDLSDPGAPRVAGVLEIPGFSTYLHRLDGGHLLSVGFDAKDRGDAAILGGLSLQVFDVKDPARPKLLHREVLGGRGSTSEAALDPLAFTYLPERGLLALPVTRCPEHANKGDRPEFEGLMLWDVSLDRGFVLRGSIPHAPGPTCRGPWFGSHSVVKRSVLLGNRVVSLERKRARIANLDDLGRDVVDVELGSR